MIIRSLRQSLLILSVCTLPYTAMAQVPGIKPFLTQIANGYTAEAKKALPDLLIDYPDDPGVMFLHAALVDEPKRAIPLFERISTAYSKSEWADDALLRIILYAAANKETERARRTYAQLRDNYAQSDLLPVAYDALRMSIGAPPPADRPQTPAAAAAISTTKKEKSDTATTTKAAFVLQSKPSTEKSAAEKHLAALKAKHMKVRLVTLPGAKTRYAVYIGEYATEADARKDLPVVTAACKCAPTIIKR